MVCPNAPGTSIPDSNVSSMTLRMKVAPLMKLIFVVFTKQQENGSVMFASSLLVSFSDKIKNFIQ